MPVPPRVPPSFVAARERLDEIIAHLETDEVAQMDHATVEALVGRDGREVLRRLLQGHFELRALREEREPMTGADGEVRHHQRTCDRGMNSVFGSHPLTRLELRARGVEGGLRPLDAELNLPPNLYSFGVHRLVAWFSANESFDAVVETLETTIGMLIGKRRVEDMAEHAAVDFDAFYSGTAAEPIAGADLMILSFDGKGVVMLPDSLRPATRKAAERGHRLAHRLSPGEKNGRKRMAEVATVYELVAAPRSADDIVAELDGEAKAKRPRALNKRVWASLEKHPIDVIEEAFAEARSRDPDLRRTWVVLVDGNPDQLRYAKKAARRAGVKPIFVLDLIHVLEYLWNASWCLFSTGDPEAEAWVTERLRRLLEGDVSGVAAGIRRSATKRGLEPAARAAMDKCADYLLKYKSMLRYDEYLAAGSPIATGVIEGACRHLIQDRMDITGARWGLDRGEAVLRLRALRSSGDFDAYWDFHLERELERNHLADYAAHELTHLRAAA
jgi:hypothetical protein